MTDWVRSCLVRVRRDRLVCGGGFLIDAEHVITCAHVVNSAVGLDDTSQDRPGKEVEIDFPETDCSPIEATVEEKGWFPIDEDGSWDVAVLRLSQRAPPGCQRPPFIRSANAQDHNYRARGFPDRTEGLPTGVPATGKICELAGPRSQWRLLSLGSGPYKAQKGFSGCPVLDEEGGAVVGMYTVTQFTHAEADRSAREAGYMITIETLLSVWPDLERRLGWRVRFDPQYERHWEPHSRGVKDSQQEGQLFTGRTAVLERLDKWIESGHPNAALVTGRRGSGKSAVLAQIVIGGDPEPSSAGGGSTAGGVALTLVADRETANGVLTEEGMTVFGAAAAVANWTGVEAEGPREVVEELRRRALAGARPPLIVVDQLDEAADRLGLAQFLGRLAREGAARVLVGLRTDEGESGASVRRAVGAGALRLDLDSEFRDDVAALEYARKLLRLLPDAEREKAGLEGLAEQIASRAGESFLRVQTLANLFVAAGKIGTLAEQEPSTEAVDEVEESLRIVTSLMGGDQGKTMQRLRHLLTPLAYAGPDGLPVEGRAWSAMASALSPRSYTSEDVANLLAGPVAQLIQPANLADGSPSASLYHAAHIEGLRDGRDAQADHGRIAAELSRLCSAESSEPAEPYVALELGRHVAQATSQVWQDLADQPHVLDRLDPVALGVAARPLLLRGAKLPPQVLGALDSQHLGASSDLADRTGLRQLGMARVCRRVEFKREPTTESLSSWWLVSAALAQHPPHLTLAAGSAVNGVATLVDSDGIPLIVAGCEDHSVRLWNVATGRPHGDPPGGECPVRAIAACETETASWLVFGDERGLVRHWDPATEEGGEFRADHGGQLRAISAFVGERGLFVITAGDSRVALLWHEGEVVAQLMGDGPMRALASRASDAGAEVAAGNDEHCVLLWELPTSVLDGPSAVPRLQPGQRLRGAKDWLRSVALYGEEAMRVAAAGDDCKPRVWAPPQTAPVMDPRNGHQGPILTTVAYEESPGDHRLATAGTDRAIRLWDPSSPASEGPKLEGHDGPVRALATHRIDGAISLVSGGVDETVRIWPLANAPSRSPEDVNLTGRSLTALGRCEINGAVAAVAGYADGSARGWNPSTGRPVTSWIPAHAGAVRAIAPITVDGKPAFATGGNDGEVRFFDPLDGKEVAPPLVGHRAPVRALVDGLAIDGKAVVATGSEDGTVRFWRVGREQKPPMASWPQPGPVRDLAPVTGHPDGAPLAVAGYGRSIHMATAEGRVERRDDLPEAHHDWVMAVEAYTDEFERPRLVTVGDDGAVIAFDPLAKEPPERIGRHDGPVRALALLPRGRGILVASGGEDGMIVLWDPNGAGAVIRIKLGFGIESLSALGERLLVGTAEGHLVVEVKSD